MPIQDVTVIALLSFLHEDPDSFLKSARLQRLPSSSSEMGSQDVSPLRETSKDPFSGDCSCRQDGLTVIITACLTFATGVTVALIMQIYFGDPQVSRCMIHLFLLYRGPAFHPEQSWLILHAAVHCVLSCAQWKGPYLELPYSNLLCQFEIRFA